MPESSSKKEQATTAAQTSSGVEATIEYSKTVSKELISIKPRLWHSILTGEDLVVAALRKSLRRQGIDIPLNAAINAARDVMGEVLTGVATLDKKAAATVELYLTGKDGSGEEKYVPPPNP